VYATEVKYSSSAHADFRAHIVIADMSQEYICIVLAPLMILMWDMYRSNGWDLGQTPGVPLRTSTLMGSLALQIGVELIVDSVCWMHEERQGIPMQAAWRSISKGRLFIVQVISTWVAYQLAFGNFSNGANSSFEFEECWPKMCTNCTAELPRFMAYECSALILP
jgi:hypothetical protein